MNNDIKIKAAAEEAGAAFVKNYKYPLPDAVNFFYDNMVKNEEVSKLIIGAASAKQLSKSATFKNFIKKNKKELYYKLRQYKSSDEDKQELMQALADAKADASNEKRIELLEKLAAFHVSSQERFDENEKFYDQLTGVAGNAVSIIDVGCGVQPLFFPKHEFTNLKKYVALDKDREAVKLMHAFKGISGYDWLFPQVWNINEEWGEITSLHGIDSFEVALILKVVPVVKRIDPALLDVLAQVPAKTIVISGVKESMVKKHDIEHKERKVITLFIKTAGRKEVGSFELENEFFIITE
jgi:16S rRNA (guanine(1405)-N(7))-methyltransferase